MPLPESKTSATKTVLLVHTNQYARNLGPMDVRREHNARCNTNCKTSLANVPLSRKTTSTRKLPALPRRPPPLPPLDQVQPLLLNRAEPGVLSRGEALGADGHQRVELGIKLVVKRLIRQLLLPLLLLLLLQNELSPEEVLDRGVVHAVSATKSRHERSPGSHVTDRDCRTQRASHLGRRRRPCPRRQGLRSPWSVVRLAPCLLSALALHHLRLPLAVVAVVVSSGEGCSD